MWWLQANTVTEIDRTVTMPSKGYSDLDHYYNDATYIHQLGDSITMPFLCLTAKNDPFVPEDIIPTAEVAAGNENIFIVNTPRVGGHIGFWLPGRGCWATKACLSFFDSVRQTITPTSRSKLLRRASSLKAAHYLERTSAIGLNDYFNLVAHDSDYSFSFGDEENACHFNDQAHVSSTPAPSPSERLPLTAFDGPATSPSSHNDLTKCISNSMLNAFSQSPNRADDGRAAVSCSNQLVRQFGSFVF